MNYIETQSEEGNQVLIPVRRIKYILLGHWIKGYYVSINLSGKSSFHEPYGNDENAAKERYQQLKEIIKGE